MKRFFKWAGYLLLPIAILFFIGLLQWENITYFVARKVLQHYASQEKLIVEIGAIDGRPFSETTVEGISVRPSAEQPQSYQLKVQSITCTYNLWDMGEGADLFLQGLSCSAQSPELAQDLSVRMPQAEAKREALQLPAVLPRLDIYSGKITLTNTGWNVEIEGIDGLLQTLDASHELQLQAEAFRFAEDGEIRIDSGFTSQLRYTDEKLSIDSLEIGDQHILATGSVDLAQIQQERAGFTAELAFTDNKLNIEGSFADRLLQANVRTENFDIGELQRRLGGSGWDVSGNIRAEADLAVNLEQPVDSRGSFVLEVDNGQVHGVEIEAVSVEGNFDHEALKVFHAEARTPDNHILVKELLLPMDLLQAGETFAIIGDSSAQFQADIKDSAALLKLIKVEGEALPAPVRPESLSLSGSLDNGVVYLDGAKAATAASSLVIDRAAIPVPAAWDGFTNLPIDLSARFESKNLDEFAGLFSYADIRGQGAADIAISGTIKEPEIKVHLTGELQRRLGGSGWDVSGNIRAEADLAVNLEQPVDSRGSFVLAVDNGQLHGVEFEAVSVEGNFDNESLKVFHAGARTLDNHILVKELLLPMDLLQAGDTLAIINGSSAQFQANIKDFAILLKLIRVKSESLPASVRPESLSLSGSLGNGVVYLDGAKAATAASSLVIDRAAIPVPAIQDGFANLPIDLSARFESKNLDEFAGLFSDADIKGQGVADLAISGTIKEPEIKVHLTGENLSVSEVELGALAARVEVQLLSQEKPGAFTAARFTVSELTQTNETGELLLTTPAVGSWEQNIVSLAASFQIDESGEVNVELAGNPAKELSGAITARNLYSTGWFAGFIDDRYFFKGVDLKADFKGLPGSPHLQLVGAIKELGAADVDFPLTGSFSLLYSPKGIKISEFIWNSYERNTLTVTGFLPYDPLSENPLLRGDIALEGYVDFPSLEDVAIFLEPWGISKGSVDLDMNVAGSWDRPQGQILFRAKGLQPPDSLKQYVDSAMDISCDIVAEDDTVFLKTATLDSALYTAQATGSWQHGFSLKGLMQGRQTELRGQVTADADVQLKDFNFLRNRISGLRRLEGDLQAKVHVAGPISDPAVTGSFSFIDGEISHSFNFPMLSAINLQGKLDGKSIIISNMQLEMGGSPVTMSGSISRDQEAVEVSLQLTGKNVLLFRNNDMLIRGDVQLDVAGPLERLVIKGSTGLTAGYYARNIDFLGMIGSSAAPVSEGVNFLFSFQDPPLNQAIFDIRINAIEPFRIRNNVIRGSIRPDLSLRGTGKLPFLVGTVYIDPARVLLPSGRLRIQSGLLRFLEANPDRPELNIVAQSRLLGYDINLITSGPLNDLAITLSSSPPLSNEDLMLLLLTGQPPRNDVTADTQGTASANVMLYLGSDFLNRWLDDESGSSVETIYDRFDLDFGRDVTKSGDQTVESSFRLSEEVTGKGRAYYLTGEKDKYDAYNYGLRVVFHFE